MVVGWLCKKQGSVALSTMEAEFVAASQVTAEMLGIAELLVEIGLKVEMPYKLHVDNQAAIKQIQGEDMSGRAKHIDVRFKFVKDLSRKKALEVNYCESKAMRADILTRSCRRQDLKSCDHSSCSRRVRTRRSVETRRRQVRRRGRL
ncbi:Retrotransposon protein [Phytophthora megakarya]|uniref:Retrotransposon protein n=1 Tax=Phytophthora megakarya TaxID=4795 RepID=A0A225WNV1_9STRA|nr:Retrotransposon protein [Phytophthora megakarya]